MIIDNISFVEVKEGKEWKFKTEKWNLLVAKGKTKKECIKNALEFIKSKQKEGISIKEAYIKNRKNSIFKKHNQQFVNMFKRVFNIEMPICYITYLITGCLKLDVIKLDRLLRVPEGISQKDFIKSKYGIQAVRLCEVLI